MCLLDSDKDFVVSLWPWRTGTRQENRMSSISKYSVSLFSHSTFKVFTFKFCVCICMWVYAHECRRSWRPGEGAESPELESQAVVYGLV